MGSVGILTVDGIVVGRIVGIIAIIVIILVISIVIIVVSTATNLPLIPLTTTTSLLFLALVFFPLLFILLVLEASPGIVSHVGMGRRGPRRNRNAPTSKRNGKQLMI